MDSDKSIFEWAAFQPELHLSKHLMYQLGRIPFEKVRDDILEKWKQIKEGGGYRWGDAHIYIDDGYGRPALKLLVMEKMDHVGVWSARNNCSIGDVKNFAVLEDWAQRVSAGLTRCNACGEWVEAYKPYSFAGAVCSGCYDPERHRPPDSR